MSEEELIESVIHQLQAYQAEMKVDIVTLVDDLRDLVDCFELE
jgi:hypothetical protein